MRLIQTIPNVFQCISNFDRIQEYCNYTLDPDTTTDTSLQLFQPGSAIDLHDLTSGSSQPRQQTQKNAITFAGESFGWTKEEPHLLDDLHLRIEPGVLTVIIGPVGSGKSTFLESIVGETIPSSGELHRRLPSAAYCAQQPWLENGTIRSNIIGVSPYDRAWYKTVKSACGLDPDMTNLERGDQTLVGSKGVNLSGGQKQRIVSPPFFLPIT